MIRDRHGTHVNTSEAQNPAKDRLRESFEQYAKETRERRERLEESRRGEARYIWAQAGWDIAEKTNANEGVTEND